MLQRLVEVREHVDALETETLRADPEKLNTYADELAGMCQEMHEIYEQETASFCQLGEEHRAQLGQEDLNALEETLEAAEEAAKIIASLRADMGATNAATKEKITLFEQDITGMHQKTNELAAAEEQEAYRAE